MTQLISTRSYFIKAMRDWIEDNQLTSYLLIDATLPGVSIPVEYVQDGRILLNASSIAVKDLVITHDFLSFSARFSGIVKDVYAPIQAIAAIYAKENGKGIFFDHMGDIVPPPPLGPVPPPSPPSPVKSLKKPELKAKKPRPNLRVVK